MGALALPIPWIPEDDLLLKNAIEAGASLESLAKGAVQFSRRFTIKELQDRWLALLYDPHISTRAAEQMVELERSASNLPSKSNRGDNSKGNKNAHGKRKVESVRKCYYAMRKRVCNESFNPSDLSFLGDNCFISGAGAPVPDEVLGDPMDNRFGVKEADFNGLFPPVTRDGVPSCAVTEFPMEQNNTYEDHMEQNATLQNSMTMEEPPGHNMFEGSGIQANPECSSRAIIYSGFEENAIFNPSISDCETTLQHLQCTSPPPAMSDWKALEGDLSIRGKNVQTRDPFVIPNDGDAGGISEYDVNHVMHTEHELNNQISTGCAAGYLHDFFDLSDDEMLMIDGEKAFEGLSSLLLDSPNDVTEDKLPSVLEAKEPAAVDTYIDVLSSTSLEEKNDANVTQLGDSNVQSSSDPQMPTSTACVNSNFPEYRDGVICCTLNMEDQEIPCNDNVVFPSKPRPASGNRRTQSETNNLSSHGKHNTGIQSIGKGPGMMKREPKRFGESCSVSLTRGPEVGLNRAVEEIGVQFEKSRAEMSAGFKSSSNGYGVPCQSSQAIKKEPSELPLARQHGCGVVEKPGQIVDLGHLPTVAEGTDQEAQVFSAVRNQELNASGSADYMAAESGGEPLLSDPEEQFSESDADIPDYSDVESMILDMDLGPEDQDLSCSREVAKYQREDVKRAIIRLEQTANSCTQRAIASHGAFAILYGRHSKHYIKKPLILLGRATEEAPVDIDLGREGHSATISRKQAIIKMDKDGSFILHNCGRSRTYVNNKEVPHGHTLSLLSNCLIEIRGMPFIFEINQAYIKQYLENAARKLEDKKL
ncbi:Microspherule protein 1 [Bienertia sinuspersici]